MLYICYYAMVTDFNTETIKYIEKVSLDDTVNKVKTQRTEDLKYEKTAVASQASH